MSYEMNQGQPGRGYPGNPQFGGSHGQSAGGYGPYRQPAWTYTQPGYGQPQYGQNLYVQSPYGPPPGYGPQPQGHQFPQPQGGASRWGPTSIGMDANLAAGLSYLVGILGIVFFFIEKTNRFLKFHAAQVILLSLAAFAVVVVEMALFGIFGGAAVATGFGTLGLLGGLFSCLFGLTYLGIVGLWLWGMIAAFTGQYTKLPIIGGIAERWAGGAPTPAF